MSLKIKDVVSTSPATEFRNDVQLADYRSIHNPKLVEGYIFTRKAVAQKKSSVDLLKHICEAFTPGRNPNRFVFMATYGHGKSHFALALANYFGKPATASESKSVLARIEHAVNDPAFYGYFKEFKQGKQPYLVLIMSGIDQRDLPTQFFNSVEVALTEETAPKNVKLPFWYKGAEKFLLGINESTKKRANELLSDQGLELDVLIERVRKQDSLTFDICHNLCQELYHTAPNFGAALNLKEAIGWLSDNLCGVDKPYSGVLILFDEFSAFVRDYGLSMNSRPGTPLQDLLDGVENCREKVAFVAFSQHDPETVARSVLHASSTASLQNLLIQLNRLPSSQRFNLHSCLEEVLDAYLRQNKERWESLCSEKGFASELYDANDVAIDVFSKRYISELGWGNEHFQEVVTKGCFPLHPMTTALLSSVELQETTNPRSVLGFVLQTLDDLKDQYACQNGKPNWILPATLVEYFKEMLGKEIWRDYIDAKAQAGGPDASVEEVVVLKGMVLQKSANVPTKQFGFDKVVGQFAGIAKADAATALQHLAGRGVIRHDAVQKLYMFWPAGRGANKVEELLVKKVTAIRSLNSEVLHRAESVLRGATLLGGHQVSVSWGHRDDWQADEMLASKEMLSAESLKKLLTDRLHFKLDAIDKVRGIVVWLIPDEPSNVVWFRDSFPPLLSQEFADSPIPLIFKRPRTHNADLGTLLRRAYGLEMFTNTERQEVGKEQYDAVVTQNNINLKEAMAILRSDSETEVLPLFRLRIQAAQPRSLEQLLNEVYNMAYLHGPKKWFTQYKLSQTALKTATKILIGHLLQNTLDAPQALNASTVAKEAVDHFIRPEWGLVSGDNRIKVPQQGAKAFNGWDVLDKYFSVNAGSKSVKKVIEQLLNPPYGYDNYTVGVLFAAWFGFNRQELEISANGRILSVDNLKTDPKEMFKQFAEISIKRRNPDELKGKVRDIIRTLQTGSYDIDGAKTASKILDEYISNPSTDDKDDAIKAKETLSIALDKAITYDKNVDHIYSVINKTNNIKDFFSALASIKKLSFTSRVNPINAGLSDVKADIVKRIDTEIGSICKANQSISTISDYGLRQSNLTNLRRLLEREDLTNLFQKVDQAIDQLNKARETLDNKEKDKESIAYINGLPDKGSLEILRKSISEINTKQIYSNEAKTIAESKNKAIRLEINRIIDSATSISKRIEKADTSDRIRAILADIHRIESLFEGAPEETLLNVILESCSFREKELSCIEEQQKNAEEHDAPLISAIQGISAASQDLISLKQQIDTITKHTFKTSVAEKIALAKIDELNNEISKLTEFVSAIPSSLEKANSKNQIQQLHSELLILKARYRGASELQLIETAINRCVAKELEIETIERAEQDRLEREKANLAEIRAMLISSPLSVLKDNVARIQNMEIETKDIRRHAESKFADITKEINRLTCIHDEILNKVEDIADTKSLRSTQSELLKQINRFEGTEEHKELQLILDRCGKIEEFLGSVEEIKRNQPQSPNEIDQHIRKLNDLTDKFKSCLGEKTKKVISELLSAYDLQLKKETKSALEWLVKQENDLNNSKKPDLILTQLIKVPVFLPSEAMIRVNVLQDKAQQMIDEDQILQVEVIFKKISDLSKRRQCLARLQALIERVTE